MFGKKYIFILDNDGKGAVIEFPAAFPYPERRTVGKGEDNIDYYITDRVREIDGMPARIYVERNCRVNIDEYATGYADDAKDAPKAEEKPAVQSATPVTGEDGHSPLVISISFNENTAAYEASVTVGTEFNRQLSDDMGENGRDVLEDLMAGIVIDMKRKAKKKSLKDSVIKDVIALDF